MLTNVNALNRTMQNAQLNNAKTTQAAGGLTKLDGGAVQTPGLAQTMDKGGLAATQNAMTSGFETTVNGTNFSAQINININISINAGSIPAPEVEQSGSTAGEGLKKDPEGWPAGSVQTAGGYTVVPEGKQCAWKIYGPGQSPGEEPLTRVWGDPHVAEKDGTKWDFTKSSNFQLPDGTTIFARTSAEQGQSVTTGLEIVNGADRVAIDGINTDKPTTGEITHDGLEWKEAHDAKGRDIFHLEHSEDQNSVSWFRERGGNVDGLITGAKLENGSYEQIVDPTKAMDGTAPAEDVDGVNAADGAGDVEGAEDPALEDVEDAGEPGQLGEPQNDLGQFMQLLTQLFSILGQLFGGMGGGAGGFGNLLQGILGNLGQQVEEENGLNTQAVQGRNAQIAA